MDSQDLRNIFEAYNSVYEAAYTGGPVGRDEMIAANNARAKASTSSTPKPTGGTTPTTSTSGGSTPVRSPNIGGSSPSSSGGGGILGSLDKTARDVATKIGGEIGAREGRSRTGNLPILGDIGATIGRSQGEKKGGEMYDNAKKAIGGFLKQDYEYDAFDIVLEYLVAEGYADTNDNALVIMANMSEEWRESILEAEVLAMKKGVPGSVQVKPALSIPGTDIGIGPNKPVPGTFTTTTPGQREKIKQGDTTIDRGVGGKQSRVGAGPTSDERRRYNTELTKSRIPGKPMPS